MKRLLPWTLFASAGTAAMVTTASPAPCAEAPPEAPPAVDVVLRVPPPPHRTLTIEWNPLTLFIDRVSFNVVIAPGDHHALVLSPFYTWSSTIPYGTSIDSNGNTLGYTLNVESQSFKGFGGELGYRYYFSTGGPRGFFVGPSVILAGITATAGDGAQTSFLDVGVAVDAGYEALIANCIALSGGLGAQYVFTTKSIPQQQLPAAIYANNDLRPRLNLSVGYAF
jgi:hypothetical protein